MTAQFTLPAPDAPAEEWGRLAVSIPGWRWWFEADWARPYGLPGFTRRSANDGWRRVSDVSECSMADEIAPDPDDPATAGWLLALLGTARHVNFHRFHNSGLWHVYYNGAQLGIGPALGRACIAAAAALGRWPGGAS